MSEEERPKNRAPLLWCFLVILHGLILLLVAYTNVTDGTPLQAFGTTVLLVPFLLDELGIPVMETAGHGSDAVPAPTAAGWFLSAIFWLALYWFAARLLARKLVRG
jgi:hypothetical protein